MSVDTAFEQLRRANPEPNPSALRRQLQQDGAQPLTSRREIMETQSPTIQGQTPNQPTRKWVPAAAAALVLALGLPLILFGGEGAIFGSPPTPVEIAERYMEARNAWDAERAEELLAPDARLDDVPIIGRDELVAGFEALRVYQFQYEPFECTETRSAPPAIVACTYMMDSVVSHIVDYPPVPGNFRFVIEDGQITRLTHNFNFGEFAPNVYEKFVVWLKSEHPGVYDRLYRVESGMDTPILTPEALELAAEYIRLYDQSVNGAGG
jgi:hypothetical protein